MKIGLFIPCYIDQLFPHVGMATLHLLEGLGYDVDFPQDQTCCGQPLFNSGAFQEGKKTAQHFIRVFENYEQIVCPSGSCVSMVRNHYHTLLGKDRGYQEIQGRVFELCEFLVDQAQVSGLDVSFPHPVGLLQSCHGLRELKTGNPSELMTQEKSKMHHLLSLVSGLKLVSPSRPDECCGFGGSFSVQEEAVSCSMGNDRIDDFIQAGAEYIIGGDMSCLMHLGGLISRQKKPVKTLHIAEILSGKVQQ